MLGFLAGIPGKLKTIKDNLQIVDNEIAAIDTVVDRIDGRVTANVATASAQSTMQTSINALPTGNIRTIYQHTSIEDYGSAAGNTTLLNYVEVTGMSTGITDYTKTLVFSGGHHNDSNDSTFSEHPLGTSGEMTSTSAVRIYCSRSARYVSSGDRAVNYVTFTIVEFWD